MNRFAFVLILGALTGPTCAQSPPELPTDEEVRQILVQRVDVDKRNVGIAVGIVSPQGQRFVSYGTRGLDDDRPITEDTVFEIGSLTKVFTTLLLADMVRRDEVELSDPMSKYLPIPQLEESSTRQTVTLADLATHTSGLPLWPSGIPATTNGALAMGDYTIEQLYNYLSDFQIPADVGTKWSYSNVDAGVLGLILSQRIGTSYGALLESRLTGPLSMTSTTLTPSPSMEDRSADGYDAMLDPAPRWRVPALVGAGSLLSTTRDLVALLAALGESATMPGAALPTMLETRRPGPGIVQALGWWILAREDTEVGILVHDGGTLGFSSGVAYDPVTRTGVVVLSNTASSVGDIARHILRPALPLTPPAGAVPERTEILVDPSLFDRYAGRYEPRPGVEFVVTREEDALTIQFPGIPKLQLRPESQTDFFVAEDPRVSVSFQVDGDGRVRSLRLTSPSADTTAVRLDEADQ